MVLRPSPMCKQPASRGALKQMSCKFMNNEPVAGCRVMIVTENVEMCVPVLVGVSGGEDDRKQVDECLAAAGAKIAPERDLPAVAIALRDLRRPGVNHDRQGDIAGCQQVAQRPHVLQGPGDAAFNAERLI